VGGVLAYITYPLFKSLSKTRKSSTAALFVCILVLCIILVPGFFFIKTLIQQSYVLFVVIKQKLALGLFQDCTNTFCNLLGDLAGNELFADHIQKSAGTVTNYVVGKASDLVISLPRLLLNVFVVFFSMFYTLRDGPALVRKTGVILSIRHEHYRQILKRFKEIMSGIINGYFFVALIQGVFGGIGFLIFGVQSPLFWGVAMAFLALIPYLGTGIVWGPAAIILFLDGLFSGSNSLMLRGIGLFIYGLLLVSSLDNFLKPKLMSDKAKIHPAIMLVGLLGGMFFFGPVGIVVGPLVLSLTVVLLEIYFRK